MQNLKHESEELIRARAHGIWEAEGRPEGRAEIHWQCALETAIAPVSAKGPVSKAKKTPAKLAKKN